MQFDRVRQAVVDCCVSGARLVDDGGGGGWWGVLVAGARKAAEGQGNCVRSKEVPDANKTLRFQ